MGKTVKSSVQGPSLPPRKNQGSPVSSTRSAPVSNNSHVSGTSADRKSHMATRPLKPGKITRGSGVTHRPIPSP